MEQDNHRSLQPTNHCSDSLLLNEKILVLGDRPKAVQAAVDKAFENISEDTNTWGLHRGNFSYSLFFLDDAKMLENLACLDKKDIYIADVGCANGAWGRKAMMQLLDSQVCKNSKKHFTILSLTGGRECKAEIIKENFVTLHQINQFKIENIDDELLSRGFDLKGKIDFMVSNWTLRHLVDPLGTLKLMYSLLSIQKGILLSNGFLYKLDNYKDIITFPYDTAHILSCSKAISLFRIFDLYRDCGHFLLMRTNDSELEIPLKYTGKVEDSGSNQQCESGLVTVFHTDSLFTAKFDVENMQIIKHIHEWGADYFYYSKKNIESKNLYLELEKKNLFLFSAS